MKNLSLLIATILFTLVSVVGVAVLFSSKNTEVSVAADLNLVLGQRALAEVAKVASATDSASAQVKPAVVVFSDFECPACASAESSYLRSLRATYANQVNFVFRHFPLDSIHPYARMVAWASEAARDEGKFSEFSDLVFSRQATWDKLTSKEAVKEEMIKYALELNIDKDRFVAKMDAPEVKERVQTDVADGLALGVNSTPTLYLNNNKTAPQDLVNQIELLLAK